LQLGALLDQFSLALSTHIKLIQMTIALPPKGTQPVTNEFRPAVAAEALERLRVLLKSSDADSEEAYHAVVREIAMRVGQEPLAALASAINEYDFEGALALLERIAGACGIEGDLDHAAIER